MLIKRIRRKLARLLIEPYDLEIVQKSYFNLTLKELLRDPDFFFIQVGAHDGVRFDDLYQKVTHENTHGIVIEPLKKYYRRLVMNYEDYPDIFPLNLALHPTEKEVEIHHVDTEKTVDLEPWSGGLGSIDKEHHKKTNIPEEYMSSTKVPALSFMELVEQYKVNKIDLLQIDVEGFDFEILKMIDFSVIKPKLIKYEFVNLAKEVQEEASQLLEANGYRVYIEGNDAIGVLANDS